jgi:hypothetical protein
MCNSLVAADPPAHQNAVRHWRAKHRRLPLRDLIFADKATGRFLELHDVYNTACACAEPFCNTVAYTQLDGQSEAARDGDPQLAAVGKFFAAHAQKEHALASSKSSSRLFTRHMCDEFLASLHANASNGGSLPIYAETIIDVSLTPKKKKKKNAGKKPAKLPRITTSKDDKGATLPRGRISPPLDSAVRGYKCGIQKCFKAGWAKLSFWLLAALCGLMKSFPVFHLVQQKHRYWY